MAWKDIKEAIYNQADAMSVADGYNYDYDTGRRVDRNYEAPTFILEYPVNSNFYQEVSKLGGVSSFQRRNRRRCLFVGRILSKIATLDTPEDELVIDGNNDALDEVLEDFLKRWDGSIPPELCQHGVKIVEIVSAIKRPLSSKGVYYPYELVVYVDIDYVTKR